MDTRAQHFFFWGPVASGAGLLWQAGA